MIQPLTITPKEYRSMKTLADLELSPKALTKRQRKLERMKKILGRDNQLPKKLDKADLLSCGMSDPIEVLKKGGYKDIKRGWVKQINRKERYHAFPFIEDQNSAGVYIGYPYIYIHRDITKNGFHVATKDVLDEKIRLKEFIIPRIHKRKNDVFLPREERLKALESLAVES